MYFSDKFICKGKEYNTIKKHVSAPIFRKVFVVNSISKDVEITISGEGFYQLFINGKNITKGILAPYISNPDDIVYYDNYNVSKDLAVGKNVIVVVLGNGMNNALDDMVWEFEKATFRSAPKLSLSYMENGKVIFIADEAFKTINSPITFDDLRCGERYDARLEIENLHNVDFDDSLWQNAILADTPKGIKKLVQAEPITMQKEIAAVRIIKSKEGYIYDFGINSAGITRLKIKNAAKGQVIGLLHFEIMNNYEPDIRNIIFEDKNKPDYRQYYEYTAKGYGTEIYAPFFSYSGFQYVLVKGIKEEQVTKDLLTYLEYNSNVESVGEFNCSDEVANRIQEIIRRSDLSNFYYFPTDCPHREKNGWTGDAALSAEQMILNFSVQNSLREWLHNIRKAQTSNGAIPTIVPTGGWGVDRWETPTWDAVLTYLSYEIFKYTSDKAILEENADAIYKYILHMMSIRNSKGLLTKHLGDWCCIHNNLTPKKVVLTICGYNILDCAEKIFYVLSQTERAKEVANYKADFYKTIRKHLVNNKTLEVEGGTQTAQAYALYHGIFTKAEEQKAFNVLLNIIKEDGEHMMCGVFGARTIFHVLTKFGEADLAYKMITQSSFPSFGYMIEKGATSLWEAFYPAEVSDAGLIRKNENKVIITKSLKKNMKNYFYNRKVDRKRRRNPNCRFDSLNHHFFGDVSAWFIKRVAGIVVNDDFTSHKHIQIAPHFIENLEYAKGSYKLDYGKINVSWTRAKKKIDLNIEVPSCSFGKIILPKGYQFLDKQIAKPLFSGKYEIIAV